jgi:S-adenosylmethionine:tRNA-ribosyltransferase-isomerase (queuine synthetase)
MPSNISLMLRSAEEAPALTAPRPASRATPLVCCSFSRSWRFEDRQIADLPASLRPGDLLVFNDTKVIPARLVRHHGAAPIEVALHRAVGGEGRRSRSIRRQGVQGWTVPALRSVKQYQ